MSLLLETSASFRRLVAASVSSCRGVRFNAARHSSQGHSVHTRWATQIACGSVQYQTCCGGKAAAISNMVTRCKQYLSTQQVEHAPVLLL